MILTTSNVTGAIDLAFVDRADIKQYIGPPSPGAIFKIYLSCISELMKVRINICINTKNYLKKKKSYKVKKSEKKSSFD